MQALDAKLEAVLRQVEARGTRDPGDGVPPGVAVQSPAPLSTEDQAVLEKLENHAPPAEGTDRLRPGLDRGAADRPAG